MSDVFLQYSPVILRSVLPGSTRSHVSVQSRMNTRHVASCWMSCRGRMGPEPRSCQRTSSRKELPVPKTLRKCELEEDRANLRAQTPSAAHTLEPISTVVSLGIIVHVDYSITLRKYEKYYFCYRSKETTVDRILRGPPTRIPG